MTGEQKTYLKLALSFVGLCGAIAVFGRQGENRLLDSLCVILAFSVIMLYLAAVTYLMDYLRRSHTTTWVDLGQPRMTADRASEDSFGFAQAGFATLGFVFSTRYRSLKDNQLNRLIWLIRILFVIASFSFPLLMWASL